MPDIMQQQKDYAFYRLERAEEDLQSAKELFTDGHYRGANNRIFEIVI